MKWTQWNSDAGEALWRGELGYGSERVGDSLFSVYVLWTVNKTLQK